MNASKLFPGMQKNGRCCILHYHPDLCINQHPAAPEGSIIYEQQTDKRDVELPDVFHAGGLFGVFFCHFCETTSLDELEKLLKKYYSTTVAAKLYLYLRKTP